MGCFCSSEDTDVELVQVSDLENQIANSSGSSSHPGNEEDDHGFATNLRNFFSPKLFTSSYWEGNFKFAVVTLVTLLCFFGPILSGVYHTRNSPKPPITYHILDDAVHDVSESLDSSYDVEYQPLYPLPQNFIDHVKDGMTLPDSYALDIDDSKANEVPQSPASPIDPSQTNEENKDSNQDIGAQPVQDANAIPLLPASATIPNENTEENKDLGGKPVLDADVLKPEKHWKFRKIDPDDISSYSTSSFSRDSWSSFGPDSDADDESKVEEKEDEVPYSPPGDGKKHLIVQNAHEKRSEKHDSDDDVLLGDTLGDAPEKPSESHGSGDSQHPSGDHDSDGNHDSEEKSDMLEDTLGDAEENIVEPSDSTTGDGMKQPNGNDQAFQTASQHSLVNSNKPIDSDGGQSSINNAAQSPQQQPSLSPPPPQIEIRSGASNSSLSVGGEIKASNQTVDDSNIPIGPDGVQSSNNYNAVPPTPSPQQSPSPSPPLNEIAFDSPSSSFNIVDEEFKVTLALTASLKPGPKVEFTLTIPPVLKKISIFTTNTHLFTVEASPGDSGNTKSYKVTPILPKKPYTIETKDHQLVLTRIIPNHGHGKYNFWVQTSSGSIVPSKNPTEFAQVTIESRKLYLNEKDELVLSNPPASDFTLKYEWGYAIGFDPYYVAREIKFKDGVFSSPDQSFVTGYNTLLGRDFTLTDDLKLTLINQIEFSSIMGDGYRNIKYKVVWTDFRKKVRKSKVAKWMLLRSRALDPKSRVKINDYCFDHTVCERVSESIFRLF
eukprot:286341_1